MNTNRKLTTRRMVESAIMLAVGTVLSLFTFTGPWALGGGITFCSMLPLVLISWRYGCGWGLFTAFVYSLLQMLLGISNVQYADSVWTAVLIILFDYVIAFSVIGLSAMFKGRLGNPRLELVLGITVTFLARLACHYVSGVLVWEVLWPNELGWAAPIWSIAYNASYMVPEIIITALVAMLIYAPMGRYFRGEDLKA
ncbi:MAG TPA: energy-coupled thiamine transporter ThiT [Candidatus Onthomonas avicola]|nr:energy-coupled thiamine transporter ThiT [Candidatus Onthomonas avicola]